MSYGDHIEPTPNNNLIDESKVYEIMDSEWKIYISNLAWNNVKDSFGDVGQQVFLMDTQGKSISHIIETLDITESNVYKTRSRVRHKLAKEIKAFSGAGVAYVL